MWRGCAEASEEGTGPLYLVLPSSPENLRISHKDNEGRENRRMNRRLSLQPHAGRYTYIHITLARFSLEIATEAQGSLGLSSTSVSCRRGDAVLWVHGNPFPDLSL